MPLSTLFHRAFALLLLACIVALIGISIWSFANNLGQTKKNNVSTLVMLMNGQKSKLSKSQLEEFKASELRPSLTFSADKLSLPDKTISGTLRLEIPQLAQREYVDTNRNNAKIFDCSGSFCVLKPQYKNDVIQVQMLSASPDPGVESEVSQNITWGQIDASAFGRALIPVTIPLIGYPELYPQDSYNGDMVMSFQYMNGIDRQINGKTPTGADADLYSIDPGNVGSSQNVDITPLTDNKGAVNPGYFHVNFSRPSQNVIYVYAVALIPLLFALLFLHLLFFSKHFPHKIFEEFTEALLVVILAVLPLRVVLVPASLEGLTRVDLVLGIGLVLVVSVAVGKYAAEIWGAKSFGTVHEAESHEEHVHEERLAEPHAGAAPAE